jgi:hypothetical protein
MYRSSLAVADKQVIPAAPDLASTGEKHLSPVGRVRGRIVRVGLAEGQKANRPGFLFMGQYLIVAATLVKQLVDLEQVTDALSSSIASQRGRWHNSWHCSPLWLNPWK